MHLNNHLPPVGCPLLVKIFGDAIPLVRAERTGHITDKNAAYEIRLEDGTLLTARWLWTYP